MMIRGLDLFISIVVLILALPILLVSYLVSWLETGSPLFVQDRVGQNLRIFKMFKIRTMYSETAEQATHLIDFEAAVPRLGKLMRQWKIDELPQLLNVIRGDMSLVGPRPNLPNQRELINLRKKSGIYLHKPGVTGIAQVCNVDMSSPERLVQLDSIMIQRWSTHMYFKLLVLTLVDRGSVIDIEDFKAANGQSSTDR
jgi:lipopolysaccharide/colanic/teichoic acid biosynthesis glycosyltransferase